MFMRRSVPSESMAARMNSGSRRIFRGRAFISIVVLTFLSAILFPHHVHFDHVAHEGTQDSSHPAHGHAVAAHAHIAKDISHGDSGHEVSSAAEVAIKSPGIKLPWYALLITLLLILPFVAQSCGRTPAAARRRLPRFDRRKAPPLRAPPRACFL